MLGCQFCSHVWSASGSAISFSYCLLYFLVLVADHLVGAKEIILPTADVPAENIVYYVMQDDIVVYPIQYSIPKANILSEVPNKTTFALNESSRSFQIKNYKFGPLEENEYHLNVQSHRFGDTRRKGGWDCLRHYEYLANGCLPVFQGLETVPATLMRTLPRDLLFRARDLFLQPWENTESGPGIGAASDGAPSLQEQYEVLAKEALRYTAEHLSTESTARYLLDTMAYEPGSKVLFLACSAFDNFPSFLTSSVFHGLVSILGDDVIDVPCYDYAYEVDGTYSAADEWRVKSQIWGQGFTLGFKLPRRSHLDRSNITERIHAREFGLIIFGRMSPYEPCNFWFEFAGQGLIAPEYFEDVFGAYPRERVALLFGDDSGTDDANVRTYLTRQGSLQRSVGIPFVRELLPFVATDGPVSDVVRPVDDRLLQPGCFYPEWRHFFTQWHRTPGLKSCVTWGNCNASVVDRAIDLEGTARRLPTDQAVLTKFCRTGLLLRAALLAQRLGPLGCMDNEACTQDCGFCMGHYAKGLLATSSASFFSEFGVTPAAVAFALSLGCKKASMALQPAMAETRHTVAVIPRKSTPWEGPYVNQWQLRYLVFQGFTVLFGSDHTLPQEYDSLAPFVDNGRMHLIAGASSCAWQADATQPLHLLHLEAEEADEGASALICVSLMKTLPMHVSVQLPRTCIPSATGVTSLRRVVSALAALGYQRFKASKHVGEASLVGDLALHFDMADQWKSPEEVSKLPHCQVKQVHAAI